MTLADYQAEKTRLKQEIRFVKGKQDFYMGRATKCTMSYEPRIGKTETRNLQPMESAVVDMIPYSEQLDSLKRRMQELNDQFRKTIRLIHDTVYETLLELKYIDEATEDELRKALHYERSTQYELLSKARYMLEQAIRVNETPDTNGH